MIQFFLRNYKLDVAQFEITSKYRNNILTVNGIGFLLLFILFKNILLIEN